MTRLSLVLLLWGAVAAAGCEVVASFDREKIPPPRAMVPSVSADSGAAADFDASLADAGGMDASPGEGGMPDAGAPEGGASMDAAEPDAAVEAGVADAGPDAGDAG